MKKHKQINNILKTSQLTHLSRSVQKRHQECKFWINNSTVHLSHHVTFIPNKPPFLELLIALMHDMNTVQRKVNGSICADTNSLGTSPSLHRTASPTVNATAHVNLALAFVLDKRPSCTYKFKVTNVWQQRDSLQLCFSISSTDFLTKCLLSLSHPRKKRRRKTKRKRKNEMNVREQK